MTNTIPDKVETLLVEHGAEAGAEYARHRQARRVLYNGLEALQKSAKAGNPLRRLGRMMTTGKLGDKPHARHLRHPEPADAKVDIWATPWTLTPLPDGTRASMRVMAETVVLGGVTEDRLALQSTLLDGRVQSHGVISHNRYRNDFRMPETTIGSVGRVIEPSVYGWNHRLPDYFCEMSDHTQTEEERGLRVVRPDSPEAEYLFQAATGIIAELQQ